MEVLRSSVHGLNEALTKDTKSKAKQMSQEGMNLMHEGKQDVGASRLQQAGYFYALAYRIDNGLQDIKDALRSSGISDPDEYIIYQIKQLSSGETPEQRIQQIKKRGPEKGRSNYDLSRLQESIWDIAFAMNKTGNLLYKNWEEAWPHVFLGTREISHGDIKTLKLKKYRVTDSLQSLIRKVIELKITPKEKVPVLLDRLMAIRQIPQLSDATDEEIIEVIKRNSDVVTRLFSQPTSDKPKTTERRDSSADNKTHTEPEKAAHTSHRPAAPTMKQGESYTLHRRTPKKEKTPEIIGPITPLKDIEILDFILGLGKLNQNALEQLNLDPEGIDTTAVVGIMIELQKRLQIQPEGYVPGTDVTDKIRQFWRYPSEVIQTQDTPEAITLLHYIAGVPKAEREPLLAFLYKKPQH